LEHTGFSRVLFEEFKSDHSGALVKKIELPVTDLLRWVDVPNHKDRSCKLIDLETEEIFQILHTIRNDLFHGSKQLDNKVDQKRSVCAAELMVPFVDQLTGNMRP
jgi:hypothetical protein